MSLEEEIIMAIVKIAASTPIGNNFGYYAGTAAEVCPEKIGRYGEAFDAGAGECANGGSLTGMVWKVLRVDFRPTPDE